MTWAPTVSLDEPLASAREYKLVAAVFSRLVPLKLALAMVLATWLRRATKSLAMAVRLLVSSEASEAASALAFIWFNRSEMVSPAEMATSTVDWPRWIEFFTSSRAPMSDREFWAMAQ